MKFNISNFCILDQDPIVTRKTLDLYDSVGLKCDMPYIPPMATVGFKKTSGSSPFSPSPWFAFVDTTMYLIRVNFSLQNSFVCFTEVPPCCGNTRAKHTQYILTINNRTKNNDAIWKIKRLYPEGEKRTKRIQVPIGKPLRLACVFGYPAKMDLYWKVPDKLNNLTLVEPNQYNRYIKIDKVKKKHEGQYECYATANGDIETYSYRLETVRIPTFKVSLENHTVDDEAIDVSFNCITDAEPRATITWFINGTKASEHILYADRLVKISGNGGETLTFKRVSERTRLIVQCNASNIYGSAYANGFLRVLQLPPISWATNYPQIARAVEKQTFVCGSNVFGSPMPNVTFYKYPDGEKFDPKFKKDEYIIGTQNQMGCKIHNNKYWSCIFDKPNYNYSFAVEDLKVSDAGLYVSFVENKYGIKYDSKTLRVFNKTAISLTNLTTLNSVPDKFITYEESSMEIKCVATIDKRIKSELEVTWYVERQDENGEIKKSQASSIPGVIVDTKNKDTLVLKFPKIQTSMSGTYICEGKTELDRETRSFEMIVHGRPDAPKQVNDPKCMDGLKPDIYLEDGNENGDSINEYEIETHLTAKCCSHYKKTLKSTSKIQGIEYLSLNTMLDASFKYEWDIRAVNKYGKSDPLRIGCETDDQIPEASPTNVCATNSLQNTINITWTSIKINETNGYDFGYHVKLTDPDDNNKGNASVSNFNENSKIFKGVKPFYEYKVTVASKNKAGIHEDVKEYTVRSGEGTPPKDIRVSGVELLNSKSIDNIKVSFNPIAETLQEADKIMNGYLTDYLIVVVYKNKDIPDQEFVLAKGRNTAFCDNAASTRFKRSVDKELNILENLVPYEEATIQIYPRNLRGDRGEGSDPLSFRTPMGLPFGGKELETECNTGFYHTKCDVKNPKNAKRGGVGGKTKVCVKIEGESDCACEKEIEPKDYTNFVCSDNIKECTNYTIELTPFNIDGDLKIKGSTTARLVKTSCGEIVLKKPIPSYQERDSSSVKVSWKFDSDENGVEPTHFKVEFYNEFHNSTMIERNKTEIFGFPDDVVVNDLEEDEPYIGFIIGLLGPTTNGNVDEQTAKKIESKSFKFHTGTRSKYTK